MFDLLLTIGGPTTPIATAWTKLVAADAPIGITEQAVAVYKNDLYFVGGYDNVAGAETNALYKYTPSTNTFTKLANMPTAMRYHRCNMGNGRLFVWGGYNATDGYVAKFYIYTISNNTWATGTLPTAGVRPGCAHAMMTNIGFDVYILGGANGDGTVAGTTNGVKYNPTTTAWTAIAAMPVANVNGAVVVNNDLLVVAFGGSSDQVTPNRDILTYDPVANAWAVKLANATSTTVARYRAKATVFGDEIFYWGGAGQNLVMSKYSPRTNVFNPNVGSVPVEATTGSSGFKAKNKFYTMGSTSENQFYVYDPYLGQAKPTLTVIPYQEYLTSSEFITAAGLSTNGTAGVDGINWVLLRFDSQTWLAPLKPIRINTPLDSSYGYNASGTTKTVGGHTMIFYGNAVTIPTRDEPWAKVFSRITKGFSYSDRPQLAEWSDVAVGFGNGANANYVWTSLTNGANETWARGGTTPGGQGTTLNNTSGRGNLMPMIQVTSTNFPW